MLLALKVRIDHLPVEKIKQRMAEDSTFELSKDQLDLLVIPPHLIVNKIIIASREDKKSISRLKKKKNQFK